MAVTPRAFFQPASTTGLPAFTPGSTFQIVIGSRPFNEARESYPTQSITKKKGRSFKNPQATPTQSIAKKKGRPFKTPEGVAAAAARTSSNGQFPKKRGRSLKDLEAFENVIPVTLPEPKFVPFVCEWKDCPAELHNLDTLRAHLVTVHLRKQHNGRPLVCLWRKCHQETKVVNVQTGLPKFIDKGFDFNTKDEWMNHIQEAHLKKVAWYQGDGPKTELSFTQHPRPTVPYSWLHGGPEGQATPSVRYQPFEEGRAKVNNAARFRKKRDGIYVVLMPVEDPDAYMKNKLDDGGRCEPHIDELPK